MGDALAQRDIGGLPTFGPEGAKDLSLAAGGPLATPIHLAFAATSTEKTPAE
jgi:hypothetical protein